MTLLDNSNLDTKLLREWVIDLTPPVRKRTEASDGLV